jgi:hypothetical protein
MHSTGVYQAAAGTMEMLTRYVMAGSCWQRLFSLAIGAMGSELTHHKGGEIVKLNK